MTSVSNGYSSHRLTDLRYDVQLQNHIQEVFKEDVSFLNAGIIPPGKIEILLSKAFRVLSQYRVSTESYYPVQISLWREFLIDPLVKAGMKNGCLEDLALLYAWIHSCQFAYGVQKDCQCPDAFLEDTQKIRYLIELFTREDHRKIIKLFEFLNEYVEDLNFTHLKCCDKEGAVYVCRLLCHCYYQNDLMGLKDIADLCHARVGILVSMSDSSIDIFLISSIVCKAKKLLLDANHEDKIAFFKGFKVINNHLSRQGFLYKLVEPFFFKDVNSDNLNEMVADLAINLNRLCGHIWGC